MVKFKKFISAAMMVVMLFAVFSNLSVLAEEYYIDENVETMSTQDYTLTYAEFTYTHSYTTNDEMYSVTAKAANNTGETVNCYVIAAVYNSDGCLKAVGKQNLKLYKNAVNSVVFNLDSNTENCGVGSTIKVFLWNSDTLYPLCDNLEIGTNLS